MKILVINRADDSTNVEADDIRPPIMNIKTVMIG